MLTNFAGFGYEQGPDVYLDNYLERDACGFLADGADSLVAVRKTCW
jgi:hypothetical protein